MFTFTSPATRRDRRSRRVHLSVEGMEGRQLMTAGVLVGPAPAVDHATLIDGSLVGQTIGYLNQATTASDGVTVLQIRETNLFPQQFPYYVSVGTETMKVTGFQGTPNLNNVLAGNYPLMVQRDIYNRGPQAHAANTPIIFVSENAPPPVTVKAPPATPGGLTATAVSSSQINLSWYGVEGATGYAIYGWNGSSFILVDSTTATSVALTNLKASSTYYFKVAAFNENGTGLESNDVAATTKVAPPTAPVGFGVREVSKTQVLLAWSPEAGATSYGIYYYNTSTRVWAKFNTAYTNYIYVNVTAGAEYYFDITAINASGESAGAAYLGIRTT
jgi:hypothetical protein